MRVLERIYAAPRLLTGLPVLNGSLAFAFGIKLAGLTCLCHFEIANSSEFVISLSLADCSIALIWPGSAR